MLGRYVAGTLLVLGAAMVLAPDGPRPKPTLPETMTARPVAGTSAPAREAPRTEVLEISEAPPVRDAMAADPGGSSGNGAPIDGIEAAVAAALALDSTDSADSGLTPVAATAEEPAGDALAPGSEAAVLIGETAEEVPGGSFEGLSNTEAFSAAFGSNRTPPDEEAEPLASEALFFVTGSRVNVRAGPATTFAVVGQVSQGDSVEVIGEGGGNWAEIRIDATGATGFMSRNFLTAGGNDG